MSSKEPHLILFLTSFPFPFPFSFRTLQLRNPLLVFLFHLCFNLAPIIATIIVLSSNPFAACYYPIDYFTIVLCAKNLWRLGFHTYTFKVARSWGRMTGNQSDQTQVVNDALCLARWERVNRYFDILVLVWFIIGSFWIFREPVCNMSVPSYTLAFALLMIVWIEFVIPCLLICFILPFVFCCPVFLMRCLRFFSVEAEGAQHGASKDQVASLPVTKYIRPEGSDIQCSICLCELETDEEVRVLPCEGRHTYHKDCIDEWLVVNGICCVCRQSVFPSDIQRPIPQVAFRLENPHDAVFLDEHRQQQEERQQAQPQQNANDQPRSLAAATAHARAQRYNLPVANDDYV